MEKKALAIFRVAGISLIIASIVILIFFGARVGCDIYRSNHGSPYPDEGVWYCEELQIQVSFDASEDCYYMKGDEKAPCGIVFEYYGSGIMRILPIDDDSNAYGADNPILKCKYIRHTRKFLLVRECETGSEYKFIRCTTYDVCAFA